jgi:hypothetical protein
MMYEPVRAAGYAPYAALNVQLNPCTWIVPDLAVLVEPVRDLNWVPADKVLMPIELVSSRRRDRIDKPRLAAEVGIPYYLRVEIDRRRKSAELHLFELARHEYRPVASALAGERFTIDVPFVVDLDPADLLEP